MPASSLHRRSSNIFLQNLWENLNGKLSSTFRNGKFFNLQWSISATWTSNRSGRLYSLISRHDLWMERLSTGLLVVCTCIAYLVYCMNILRVPKYDQMLVIQIGQTIIAKEQVEKKVNDSEKDTIVEAMTQPTPMTPLRFLMICIFLKWHRA